MTEWPLTHHQLIKDATETPYIDFGSKAHSAFVVIDQFRRTIATSSSANFSTHRPRAGRVQQFEQRFRIGLAADSWDALSKSPAMKKFTPQQLALAVGSGSAEATVPQGTRYRVTARGQGRPVMAAGLASAAAAGSIAAVVGPGTLRIGYPLG